jgi:hypothetical protein
MPAAERGAPADRRFLHHDEARPLEVLDEALRADSRHEFVGVVDALAALEAEREGEGVGQVVG